MTLPVRSFGTRSLTDAMASAIIVKELARDLLAVRLAQCLDSAPVDAPVLSLLPQLLLIPFLAVE
jgi:hypothetical protein